MGVCQCTVGGGGDVAITKMCSCVSNESIMRLHLSASFIFSTTKLIFMIFGILGSTKNCQGNLI
jgi:hypothetical protein